MIFIQIIPMLLFLSKSLADEVDIVNPTCNNSQSDLLLFQNTCCVQATQVLALASVATKTAVDACSAAQVSLAGVVQAGVAVSIAVTAAAQVAVVQSIAIALDVGNCCQISANASADANANAYAAANATAEALASATAAASASATAVAVSEAASSILTTAKTIIQSSCCGFSLDVLNAVEVAGSYCTKAATIAQATANVTASTQAAALISINAATEARVSAKALAKVSIDNCCVDSKTVTRVKNTTAAATAVVNRLSVIHGMSAEVMELIEDYCSDNATIESAINITNSICVSECAKVKMSCCANSLECCSVTDNNCCLASKTVSKVYLGAQAIATSVIRSMVWAKSSVKALASAAVKAIAAVKAAANAKVAVSVKVKDCCSIKITVSTQAQASAKAVSIAIAEAKAAAQIHASGAAKALAFANATAIAVAYVATAAELFSDSCCNSTCCIQNPLYPTNGSSCCQVLSTIHGYFTDSYEYNIATSYSKAFDHASIGMKSQNLVDETSLNKVMSKTRATQTLNLKCCCCNNVTTTTVGPTSTASTADTNTVSTAYA